MTFHIVTGNEPYEVHDDTTNGVAWFNDKLDAYRHMAILRSLGRTYRLIVRETVALDVDVAPLPAKETDHEQ
jgi:hypothetical protein